MAEMNLPIGLEYKAYQKAAVTMCDEIKTALILILVTIKTIR